MADVLTETLTAWSESWRFPRLRDALGGSEPAEMSTAELVSAVLDGIAAAPPGPGATIHGYLQHGRYRAAYGVLDDPAAAGLLTEDERASLLATIIECEQTDAVDLDRRRNELTMRAERADVSAGPPTGIKEALHEGRAGALALLDGWEGLIVDAEKTLTESLMNRLSALAPQAPQAWVAAVSGCVDAKEFPAATAILEKGWQGFETLAGPAAASRWDSPWPWPNLALPEVLRWYADPAAADSTYNRRWRPADDDNPASTVMAVLSSLHGSTDEEAVHRFAAAVDELLDAPGIVHEVESVAGGFRTELAGLMDPRLPAGLLPSRLTLWLGPPGWSPPTDRGRPSVWFQLERTSEDLVPGIAALRPDTLFEVISRESDRARKAPARRIHLLRTLCRQLELADLIGSGSHVDLGAPANLRTGLAWVFDLLGVRADGVVLDTILYDTSGHPVALRGALDFLLGARDGLPGEVTVHDVARWRSERGAAAELCRRVRDDLDESGEAVLAMAVLDKEDEPDATFTPDDLGGLLPALTPSAEVDLVGHTPLSELLDLPAALRSLVAAGVVEPAAGAFRLRGPGLLNLLRRGADWVDVATRALRGIAERLETVLESIKVDLSRQAILHWIKNNMEALRIQLELIRPSVEQLPPDLQGFWNLLLKTVGDLREAYQFSQEDIRQRLTPERVDLGQLLAELVLSENPNLRSGEIRLSTKQSPFLIEASHFLVRDAFRNLITNARQAVADSPGRDGLILVRLRRQQAASTTGPQSWAQVDILDSGPGFSAELLTKFERGEPYTRRPGGEGKGLPFARAQLEHCGGTLVLLESTEEPSGGHAQVQLPLLSPNASGGKSPATRS